MPTRAEIRGKTMAHSPLAGTEKSVWNGDALEATCANCNKTIVEWNYADNDGDRIKHIYSPWAVETTNTAGRLVKDTECVA